MRRSQHASSHAPLRSLALLLALAIGSPADAGNTLLKASSLRGTGTQSANAMVWDAQGRILAVGSHTELSAKWPDASVLDAGDAHVLPGLIDAHGHLHGLGFSLMRVQLEGTRSQAEVVERLKQGAASLPAGSWVLGRGWDQNDWPESERAFPDRTLLDQAFPDRPVWLTRVDGHAGWANSAALAKAEKSLDGDWQPEGGQILRKDGMPTGVFIDRAMSLIASTIPKPGSEESDEALKRALALAVANGLTGVHDAGVSLAEFERMQRFADRDELPLRIYAMADGDSALLERLCSAGLYVHAGGRLTARAVKLYADGALGSRGAALIDDYSDEPGNRGLLLQPPEALARVIRKAADCGVQVATHAIGDRANRVVLDAYAELPPPQSARVLRHRIEHAQVLSTQDLPRLSQLGVIASMQPTHATSDMPWAVQRLSQARLAGAYAWASLNAERTRLAFGSDFPVESVDPRLGLFAAVTRTDTEGQPEGGWLPEQRLSLDLALEGFTQGAAYAGFAETEVGSLEVGKRADFILIEQPLDGASPSSLSNARILATYVDGKAVYRNEQAVP